MKEKTMNMEATKENEEATGMGAIEMEAVAIAEKNGEAVEMKDATVEKNGEAVETKDATTQEGALRENAAIESCEAMAPDIDDDDMTDEEWFEAQRRAWQENIGEHIAELMMKAFDFADGQPRESIVQTEVGTTVVAKKNSDSGIRKGEKWVLAHCEGTSVGIEKEPGKCFMMSDLEFADVFENGFDPSLLSGYVLTDADYEAICKKMDQDILHLSNGTAMECKNCGALVYKEDMKPRRHICQSCGYFEFDEADLYGEYSPYQFTYELSDDITYDVDDMTISDYQTLRGHSLVLHLEEFRIRVYEDDKVVYVHMISDETYDAVCEKAWEGVMKIVNKTNELNSRNRAIESAGKQHCG